MKFEKNENPENILIVYTLLDEACHFKSDPKKSTLPVLDFYWLMNGSKYKRTHSLIKYNIRKKLQIDPQFKMTKISDSFPVMLNELSEINKDFKNSKLVVHAKKILEKCTVTATLENNKNDWDGFNIERIFSESKKTFIPPFRKILSIRIDGINPKNENRKSKTYVAK